MIASVFLYCAVLSNSSVPDVVVDHDNVVISESCRVVIPPGTVIGDADGNGVIQVDADNITVEFSPDSVLIGSANLNDRDLLTGVGVRVASHEGVTLNNLKIRGYKLGIWASNTQSLTINSADIRSMYSQRLKSTPEAEDAGDWFYPHHNDERPWRDEYGGAIIIERSREPVIQNVIVRQGQHGIILDRVSGARIYDNDCSFLSGWGLAMWRSNDNLISRNAFDFCVRGYSHGVYNRGQDSAGILMFEQCSKNTIIENSVTHGGDGIFGFAGREAIGETTTPGLNHEGLGCNDNLFFGNDLSYAAAHGFEMTFSHRNFLSKNRFVENSICGIWGGYSHDTGIMENHFLSNGSDGYGLERGGINIEHGSGTRIVANSFSRNAAAIHLWWDNDATLLKLPGVKSTDRDVSDNLIARNTSVSDEVFLRVRDTVGGMHIKELRVVNNTVTTPGKLYDIATDISMDTEGAWHASLATEPDAIGAKRPIGARSILRGRDKIIMTQWEPWDHESALVRIRPNGVSEVLVDILKPLDNSKRYSPPLIKTTGDVTVTTLGTETHGQYKISPANKQRLTPYTVDSSLGTTSDSRAGVLLDTQWNLTFFTWDKETDPREHLDAWRMLANAESARTATTNSLSLKFGHGGPRSLKLNDQLTTTGPGNDHFGMLASTTITIPKGDWKFITNSDDGIRLTINGKPLVENWTWHGPTKNEGVHHQDADAQVLIEVEYFEIDGFAVFDLEILPAR